MADAQRLHPLLGSHDAGAFRDTTAVMVDRDGTTYPRGIEPENVVPSDQDPIPAAEAWLRTIP